MNSILLLGLLGIGIGGFYGLLASGIVIGHKGSGLINLDQGALAMYPAYTYVTMRETGDIYFPWVDFIPGPIDIPYQLSIASTGVGKFPSFVAAIFMSLLLGIAVQTLVFGPLRNKPPISKIIGSLGALFYLTSVAFYQFGGKNRTTDGILPTGSWENPLGLDGQLSYERIALVFIALLVGGGLAAYYRFTRTGLATRAVEDSESGATLLGYSIRKIATLNWVLSTLITGFAGILALDLVSLSPNRYTLFVIPALGAALFGNLTSPWLATVGGILLGVFQSATAGLTLKTWWPEWIPSEGLRHAIPLLMIIGFQYTRGHKLPVRGTRFAERQPTASAGKNLLWQILLVVSVVIWVLIKGSSVTQGKLITSIIAAILMMSSVIIIGYLGQLSLANLTFAGVAGYLSTRLAASGESYGFSPFILDGPGFPSPIAMLFGVAIAVLIGLLIAAPAIRIRGLQLAVVTLAGAVAANELIMANEPLVGKGARSNLSVPPPNWFGIDITVDPSVSRDRSTLIIFCGIWLLIVVLGVIGIRRGTTGRNFLAVRSNERAAAACGVDVSGTKLLGFGIGSAVAGIAGVLTAYQHTILQISSWDALAGITNVTLLFLGGVAHLGGALIGAAITPGGLFSATSSEGQILRNAAAGAIMIAVAIFRPDGLVSLLTIVKVRFSKSVNFAKESFSHIISTSSRGNDS